MGEGGLPVASFGFGMSGLPSIETERLWLREIKESDLDEWSELIHGDPDVMTYMPARDESPRDRAQRKFEFHAKTWAEHDYGGWLVTSKDTRELMGDCYLEPDAGSGELELGYALARRYWGQGISSEAANAVARFAFERGGVDRLLGVVMPDNVGSWRVLEKVGFVFLREDHLYDLDVFVYSLEHDRFQPDGSFYQVHD